MKRRYDNRKSFKIIPEAKIVVGRSEGSRINLSHIKQSYIDILELAATILHTYDGPDVFYATAYCDDVDEFDEDTGVDICTAKLDLKKNRKIAKRYDRIHRLLIEAATIAADLCMKYERKALAIEDDMVRTWGRTKE